MDRRSFIMSTSGLLVAGGTATAKTLTLDGEPLKAKDVADYLLSLGKEWVNPQAPGSDQFWAGDPEGAVRGIVVAWLPYKWVLEKAVELNCNLIVTHENLYYGGLDPSLDIYKLEGVRQRRDFVEKNGLIVFRCHAVWDRIPTIGIPDAWGAALGFSNSIHGTAGSGFYRVYDVKGRTAIDVARQVAMKVKHFGQDAVQLIGRPETPVSRVAIGCGAISVFRRMLLELQADLAICSNDGFVYWRDGALALDLGVPAIVVDHAVSEEPGMVHLAKRLKEAFPQVPVHHIAERCMFTVVSG